MVVSGELPAEPDAGVVEFPRGYGADELRADDGAVGPEDPVPAGDVPLG